MLLSANWPLALLDLGIDLDVVNFDHDTEVTGWRFNAAPAIGIPLTRPGAFFTPAIELDYTRYDLSNTLPGEATSLTRTVPITSVDTGIILERAMNGSNRIQTLEPRLLYVNIPFRDQDELPVFDTITPDLNLVQLFRRNRFLGLDRIGDTEQLSFGITTRVLDLDTGRELLSATLGQTRYFGDRMVTLPGVPASTLERSD
jgi:LPS-assembly protein